MRDMGEAGARKDVPKLSGPRALCWANMIGRCRLWCRTLHGGTDFGLMCILMSSVQSCIRGLNTILDVTGEQLSKKRLTKLHDTRTSYGILLFSLQSTSLHTNTVIYSSNLYTERDPE